MSRQKWLLQWEASLLEPLTLMFLPCVDMQANSCIFPSAFQNNKVYQLVPSLSCWHKCGQVHLHVTSSLGRTFLTLSEPLLKKLPLLPIITCLVRGSAVMISRGLLWELESKLLWKPKLNICRSDCKAVVNACLIQRRPCIWNSDLMPNYNLILGDTVLNDWELI